MMDCLKQLFDRFTRLALLQHIAIGMSTGVLFVALVAFSGWSTRTEFVTLFRGLDLEEASAIQKKLDARGVEYHLVGSGTGLEVPAARKAAILLDLASDTLLPARSKGWSEILAKESSFAQNREDAYPMSPNAPGRRLGGFVFHVLPFIISFFLGMIVYGVGAGRDEETIQPVAGSGPPAEGIVAEVRGLQATACPNCGANLQVAVEPCCRFCGTTFHRAS